MTREEKCARALQWYYKNKERALKRLRITCRIWQKKNKKRCYKINANYSKRHPWVKTYRAIISRCHYNRFYLKKKIKAKITVKELKKLWHRDKAYLLNKPSIDRIDEKGNYCYGNCRYIEFTKNLKRRVFIRRKSETKKERSRF